MMKAVVLFITVFMTAHVPVVGGTKLCRHCDSVRGPKECRHFKNCDELCVTNVQDIGGEYIFSYHCGPHEDCSKDAHYHLHNNEPVVCRECCHHTGCDQNSCSQYFETAKTTPTPTTTTKTITSTPATTRTTTTPTTTTTKVTTQAPLVFKGCNNMDVISGLVKGSSVSHPGTPVCPNGVHQPSEALIQEYCGAPALTNWIPGEKVLENCPRIPSYTAIAAITPVFGGATVAGVFIKCEIGGFQAAIQTCGSQLRVYHVSTNSTSDIPSADKFVLVN
ncbi:uncharacterized protein LOC123548371 [Mercenaria mercenaria]|uniref:uncharacterized protein LOC123548371 n=1 Tax=Mercenaria mercenaria TaxID=6596 RepID=UPI001E1DA9F4|nr:uncharacterized protein LOC123548371 [Mercenaria mercenaria]